MWDTFKGRAILGVFTAHRCFLPFSNCRIFQCQPLLGQGELVTQLGVDMLMLVVAPLYHPESVHRDGEVVVSGTVSGNCGLLRIQKESRGECLLTPDGAYWLNAIALVMVPKLIDFITRS